MKTSILIIFILLAVFQEAFSQSDSTQYALNHLYLEVAGAGGYGSVNYERSVYRKNNLMLSIRLGLSSYHIKDYTNKFNPDLLVPLAVNGYYGSDHKLVLGVGQTYANIIHAGNTNFMPVRSTDFHTFFSFGYHYQKKGNGLFFRIAYTPVIEFNTTLRHWAGVSFGYSF